MEGEGRKENKSGEKKRDRREGYEGRITDEMGEKRGGRRQRRRKERYGFLKD